MDNRGASSEQEKGGVAALILIAACVLATLPLFLWPLEFQTQLLPWAAYSKGLVPLQPLSVLTSVWLHLDFEHLAYNVAIIAVFAWRLERVYGRKGVLALFLLAGIPAQLAFFWGHTSAYFIAGSSGPALGLVGAFLERRFFAAHLLGRIERHPIVIGLLCLWVGLLVTQDTSDVDRVHGIGFLAGALLSSAMSNPKFARGVLLAGAIAAVLHIAAAAVCGARVLAGYPGDPAAVRWLFELASDDAGLTNNLAWYWFINPETQPEVLAEAESRLEAFTDSGLPAWGKDTLAALKHRRGALEDALELQRDAVREDPRSPLFRPLAQYEYESWQARNPQGLSDSLVSWETARGAGGLRLLRRGEGGERLPERALLLNGEDVVGYLETPSVNGETPLDDGSLSFHEAIELETSQPTHVMLLPLPGPSLVVGSEGDATVWWVSTEVD